MKRRDVLKTSSLILGYSLTAGTAMAVLNGCKADPSIDWTPKNLSPIQALTVAEMAEMIIPRTDTPGAKDALVDRFIDEILDCYPDSEKQSFIEELDAFITHTRKKSGKHFYEMNDDEKTRVLDDLISVSDKGDRSHLFFRMREWTVTAYCKSEAGATEHLEWNPVPGPYRGCIDFDEIGKTWAIS